jgi:UDP-N-acetylglucosamine 2-epimerase (non-hydrolysing)
MRSAGEARVAMSDAAGAARVLVVIGTRPEAIKLAPVVHALHRHGAVVETRVVLTGQHTDLVDQALTVFRLEPSWSLQIMRAGQNMYDIAHGCLAKLRDVVADWRPELILVQGDTGSVFFGALVGLFERIPVGHVEAGLRSGDKWRPYPEEMLRRLTGVVSDVHFAPTPLARANLLAENVAAASVHLTGNTVVDALEHAAALPHSPQSPALRAALASSRRLVLVTAHRRESFGEPLRHAFTALRTLADRYEDVVLLYPVHPNPQVRSAADELLAGHERILLCDPLSYLDLVAALRHATLAITDSGGIQEEAPTFGVPVLVLREVTERPEGVSAGVAQLVGTDPERIVPAAAAHLEPGRGRRQRGRSNPYGDGRAGERIAEIVLHTLRGRPRTLGDWVPQP